MVIVFFWGMNIWGGWAEQYYEKYKGKKRWFGGGYWYELERRNIPLTKENCVASTKRTSWIGIIVSTLFLLLVLFFGE
jgi:hypothetical protein